MKTFEKYTRANYEIETEAWRLHKDSEGIVTLLCAYSQRNSQKSLSGDIEYNMVLEYGELDLDEYFYENIRSPPVLFGEIHAFWHNLSSIANGLSDIHTTKSLTQPVYYG